MKKTNGRREVEEIWLFYQEKLIKHSDINNNYISNDRAKKVLGSYLRLEPYIQIRTLDDMERKGLIKQVNKRLIAIVHV